MRVNSKEAAQRALKKVVKDGQVTKREAAQLVKTLKKNGLSGDEIRVLNDATSLRRDAYQTGSRKPLRRALASVTPNQASHLQNAVTRSLANDGKIDHREARDILHQASRGGLLNREQRALAQIETRIGDKFTSRAQRSFDRFQEGIANAPARTKPDTIRVSGVQINTNGASQEAIDRLREIIPQLLRDPQVAARLRAKDFVLAIVPFNQRLTDVPEGKWVGEGGRADQGFRGYGDVRKSDGRPFVLIGEEDLLDLPSKIGRDDYSLAHHEIGHAVLTAGVTRDQREQVYALFLRRQDEGDGFTSSYARTSFGEYFAEATAAFFSQGPQERTDGRAALRRRDPELFRLLTDIYR